jgi:hypothetical protein
MHLGMVFSLEGAASMELGAGEDQESAQVVLVEVLDRVQQIAVERHQATERGANSRVTVRRSVKVQP